MMIGACSSDSDGDVKWSLVDARQKRLLGLGSNGKPLVSQMKKPLNSLQQQPRREQGEEEREKSSVSHFARQEV